MKVFEKNVDGEFEPTLVMKLKKGDRFRIWESRKLIEDENGFTLFEAVSNPYISDEVWKIDYAGFSMEGRV